MQPGAARRQQHYRDPEGGSRGGARTRENLGWIRVFGIPIVLEASADPVGGGRLAQVESPWPVDAGSWWSRCRSITPSVSRSRKARSAAALRLRRVLALPAVSSGPKISRRRAAGENPGRGIWRIVALATVGVEAASELAIPLLDQPLWPLCRTVPIHAAGTMSSSRLRQPRPRGVSGRRLPRCPADSCQLSVRPSGGPCSAKPAARDLGPRCGIQRDPEGSRGIQRDARARARRNLRRDKGFRRSGELESVREYVGQRPRVRRSASARASARLRGL